MYLKKIMIKISPSYRKLVNEIEPRLNNVRAKLDALESVIGNFPLEIEKIKNKAGKIEKQVELIGEKIKKLLEKDRSPYKRVFYSQDGEDVVLASFYEEMPDYKGFYVDIGAFHPLRFSNTQYFYERGWRGINIDATPGSMKEFERLRPLDVNIEIGVSEEEKELTFYSFKEPALNSFDKKISEERIKLGWELIERIKVKTKTINEILEKNMPVGQHIDFLNIDVEGLDFEILKSLDWKRFSPNFILIEDFEVITNLVGNYTSVDVYKYLGDKGYDLVARTRRTLIFKKNEKDDFTRKKAR